MPDVRPWTGLDLVEPLAGGARNSLFLARRGSHTFVVRTSTREPESLDWELDLLTFLRSHDIRVPHEVPTDDGRRHAEGVLVQQIVRGHPPASAREWRQVRTVLTSLHDLTRGWPQRPGFASSRELLRLGRGGDVDLAAVPAEAVEAIRTSWLPLHEGTECVVHGDVGGSNILIDGDAVTLLDWDEARVDTPWFDFAGFPLDVEVPAPCDRAALVTAGIAWEVATCWKREPDYAARRLAELE